MSYGIPYTGSKNTICKWLLQYIPKTDVFVDVFTGGAAVAHAVISAGKANRVIANDISEGVVRLLNEVLSGKYVNESRWVSRDEFIEKKESDPFIKFEWSYGNEGFYYVYATAIQDHIRALHRALVDDNWDEFNSRFPSMTEQMKLVLATAGDNTQLRRNLFKRQFLKLVHLQLNIMYKHKGQQSLFSTKEVDPGMENVKEFIERDNAGKVGRTVAAVGTLIHLMNFDRMKEFAQLDSSKLCITQGDYRQLDIPQGAFIYCDPPYIGSRIKYKSEEAAREREQFDFSAFYDWCAEKAKTSPLLISEVTLDDDRFELIGECHKISTLNQHHTDKWERLDRVKEGITWDYPKVNKL